MARVTVVGMERSAVSDPRGRFVLRSLPAGRHRIEVSLLGHAPAYREVTVGAEPVEMAVVLTPTPLSIEGVSATANATGSDPLSVARSTTQLSGRALERELGGRWRRRWRGSRGSRCGGTVPRRRRR